LTAQYVGSPYHKRYPWFGQGPQLLSDKSECPPDVVPDEARTVLERDITHGLALGRHSSECQCGHPKYVWGRSEFAGAGGLRRSIVWEARLTNAEVAAYKAYPIQPGRHSDCMPFEIAELLWPVN